MFKIVDRAIFLWSTKDWKGKDHRFIRYNVDLDYASLIKWSPDSKGFIYYRHADNLIEACKINRKPDGWISSVTKAFTYPTILKNEILNISIDINGRYMMIASVNTEIVILDLKGNELVKLDSYLMNNYAAKISPCGRFFAVSGFSPDVKVWEMQFTRSGEFKQAARAFELTGHSSGIYDFAFNADSSMIATVSKDGSWRLYNIKIEFDKGEEPRLLKTSKYKMDGTECRLALSPDGNVLALTNGPNLTIVNLLIGQVDKVISNIYMSGSITKVIFDSAGKYILTSGDKHVRIFHNITGRKVNINLAKTKLKDSSISVATRERLNEIIEESQNFLNSLTE